MSSNYNGIFNLHWIFLRLLNDNYDSTIKQLIRNNLRIISERGAGQYVDASAPDLNQHLNDIIHRLDNSTITELPDQTPPPIDIPDFSQAIDNYEYLIDRSWYFRDQDLINRVRRIVDADYGHAVDVLVNNFSEHVNDILTRIENGTINQLQNYSNPSRQRSTPRSQESTPRSQELTPRSQESTPQSSAVIETEQHPESIDDKSTFADRLLCSICMTNSVNMRLDPCGHLVCSLCVNTIRTRLEQSCPTCRTPIIKNDRIFYGGNYKNKLMIFIKKQLNIIKQLLNM